MIEHDHIFQIKGDFYCNIFKLGVYFSIKFIYD